MSTEIDRLMRDFNRYTGDGLPQEPIGAALPIGDPRSGAFIPKKKDLRDWGDAIVADVAVVKEDFVSKYLGSKASDPTLDNGGNPLVNGALYFNTTSSAMKVRNAGAWVFAYVPTSGVLVGANNLSDLTNVATAQKNLGLDSTIYRTAGTSTAYTITMPITAYFVGLRVRVNLHTQNGSSPTINVNGKGAKALQWQNGAVKSNITNTTMAADQVYTFIYDGTSFVMDGSPDLATSTIVAGTSQVPTKIRPVELAAAIDSRVPTGPDYTSPEVSLTLGTYISASHGLGDTPAHFGAFLRCIDSSNAGGYAINDCVQITASFRYSASASAVGANKTAVFAYFWNGIEFCIKNDNNGYIIQGAGLAKWKLEFRAWK